jgi:hypothetical protein
MTVELKNDFRWCLGRAFLQLRKGFSLSKNSSNNAPSGKRGPKRGDNVEKDSTKHEEKRTPHTHNFIFSFFWETYNRIEKQNPEGKVSETMLKQELISSGKIDSGPAAQMIKDFIRSGELVMLGFDILVKNSPSEVSKN